MSFVAKGLSCLSVLVCTHLERDVFAVLSFALQVSFYMLYLLVGAFCKDCMKESLSPYFRADLQDSSLQTRNFDFTASRAVVSQFGGAGGHAQ